MPRPVVHFVGFRGEEYWSAVKVWDLPDFIHMAFDRRAAIEIQPGDTVIFATGEHDQPPAPFSFADTKERLP